MKLKSDWEIPLRSRRDIPFRQASSSQLIEKLGKYNGNVGYFLKIYFISDQMNDNYWKVTTSSIEAGLRTGLEKRFFGKTAPIIMRYDWEQTEKLGHPTPYVDDMISLQEPDRKGDFVAVGTKDDDRTTTTGWVIVKITDKDTELAHRRGEIKFVSPSIESIHENARGEDIAWRINHLAFVSDPAYGFEAQVTGSCTGTQGTCVTHLAKQATTTTTTATARLRHQYSKLRNRRDIPLMEKITQYALRRRRDIPLRQAADNKDGEWVTSNG